MSSYEFVLRGKLVLADEVVQGEVGVREGRIETISKGTTNALTGEQELTFVDEYIFPGMIDDHVHCFSNPKEGFVSTSASAAVGGITTFLDMPYDLPNPVNHVDRFHEKVERLNQEALVDICLWGTIAKRNGTDQIRPLAEAGAVAFKMSTFETDEYRFPRIPDSEILKAMNELQALGLRAAFHSENDEIIVDLIQEYQEAGRVYPRAHLETRPPVTETSAILKLLEFAYWTGVKLHIVHVSHPRSFELIQQFKKQGVQVTAETCYPYLLMDVNDLEKYGPKAKNNPPLRETEDVAGLWKALFDGEIDLISSDHVAWSLEQKQVGQDNIFRAASGLIGLEIMAPLMFANTVNKGILTPVQFAKLMAQHPAEVFSIPNKGKIATGFDADFTVIDPNSTWVIDEQRLHTNSKQSPFHNQEVAGQVVHTIVRGQVVYDGKEVLAKPGDGQFVPGAAFVGAR